MSREIPSVVSIHHVALAVRDAEKTLRDWEKAFGISGKLYTFEDHKKGTLYIGDTMFAFIEYTVPNPPPRFSEFLEKHGEGLHHIAFQVQDLKGATARVKAAGFTMLFDSPQDAGVGICNFIDANDVHADVELVEADERSETMKREVTGEGV